MLVVDAGDSLVGDMEPAVRTKGASSVEAMNRMGYDAALLGPADLSLGPATVQQRVAEARFPFLSADMTVAATGEPVAQGYVILQVDGHPVAVAGLSAAPDINGFKAAGAFETAQRIAREAGSQAGAVILLSRRTRGQPAHRRRDTGDHRHHRGWRGVAGEAVGERKDGHAHLSRGPTCQRSCGPDSRHRVAQAEGRASRVAKWRSVPLDPAIKDDPAMAAWSEQQGR